MQIDKDVVGRVLATNYGPDHPDGSDPSWLTFIAQAEDSLWSFDLVRYQSILCRSHWVIVVIDVFNRRIIGFGIDGPAARRMSNQAIARHAPPARFSTEHDPPFRVHRWLANLRIFEVEEIKPVPYARTSPPFVERLIGTIRREYWFIRSSGIRSIFSGSLKHSAPITTAFASTAPPTAPRPPFVPENPHHQK